MLLLIKDITDYNIRSLAVNNCIKLKTAKDETEAQELELVDAFPWRKTDQGYQFWANINKIYTSHGNN
jgi:hypothetical protein